MSGEPPAGSHARRTSAQYTSKPIVAVRDSVRVTLSRVGRLYAMRVTLPAPISPSTPPHARRPHAPVPAVNPTSAPPANGSSPRPLMCPPPCPATPGPPCGRPPRASCSVRPLPDCFSSAGPGEVAPYSSCSCPWSPPLASLWSATCPIADRVRPSAAPLRTLPSCRPRGRRRLPDPSPSRPAPRPSQGPHRRPGRP